MQINIESREGGNEGGLIQEEKRTAFENKYFAIIIALEFLIEEESTTICTPHVIQDRQVFIIIKRKHSDDCQSESDK